MSYSICLLDEGGRAQRTAFEPHEDDAAAFAQAHTQVAGSAIVEVWKGDDLLAKLFPRPARRGVDAMRQPSALLSERAASERLAESLAGWDNEGGAARSAPHTSRSRSPGHVVESSLPGDLDKGVADRHTLGMMQASLLLLLPVLAAIAMFWGSLAGGVPGEGLG